MLCDRTIFYREATSLLYSFTVGATQKWSCFFHFYFLKFLNHIQAGSILGTALEGPDVLCKELLFSQMNRISILQLQVSMTIKTKQSSAPTWYLTASAAGLGTVQSIQLFTAKHIHYISPEQQNCFYSGSPKPKHLQLSVLAISNLKIIAFLNSCQINFKSSAFCHQYNGFVN